MFRKILIFVTIYLSIQNWRKILILINFVKEISLSVKSFYKISTTVRMFYDVIEVINFFLLKSRLFEGFL